MTGFCSGASSLNLWVEMSEPRACVVGGEPPLDSALAAVTLLHPRRYLVTQVLGRSDPPLQALTGQNTQLDLRHVQPTPVHRRVVDLQPPRQLPRLLGRERLVQSGGRVRVQ